VTLWPAPVITSRAIANPIIITINPPMAPVVAKDNAYAPAVEVGPSGAATAKPNAT